MFMHAPWNIKQNSISKKCTLYSNPIALNVLMRTEKCWLWSVDMRMCVSVEKSSGNSDRAKDTFVLSPLTREKTKLWGLEANLRVESSCGLVHAPFRSSNSFLHVFWKTFFHSWRHSYYLIPDSYSCKGYSDFRTQLLSAVANFNFELFTLFI